jgi:hypothetical protein
MSDTRFPRRLAGALPPHLRKRSLQDLLPMDGWDTDGGSRVPGPRLETVDDAAILSREFPELAATAKPVNLGEVGYTEKATADPRLMRALMALQGLAKHSPQSSGAYDEIAAFESAGYDESDVARAQPDDSAPWSDPQYMEELNKENARRAEQARMRAAAEAYDKQRRGQ